MNLARDVRRSFPPCSAPLVELACLEPVAKGLHISHWTSHDLARQAIADGIVEAISPRNRRDSSLISTRLSRDSTWCLSGLGLRLAVFDGF